MENCNGYSNYSNSINIVVHELPNPNIYTLNNNPFCGKDSLFVECSTHLSRYFWYFKENGEGSWQYIKGGRSEKPRISIFKEGELKLFLQDDYGCSSESSTIYCKPLPNPFVMIVQDANALVAQPYLEFGGNRLYESNLQNYQWFINNQILPAEVGETIIPLLNGNYSVRVTDENGCVNISENYPFYATKLDYEIVSNNIAVYPTICSTHLNVVVKASVFVEALKVFDINGRLVDLKIYKGFTENEDKLDVSYLSDGFYLLNIKTNIGNFKFKFIKRGR